ncbi:MAG: hypothetical protein KF850_06965 [Labilithrix sp.]|nr:hypothetical protein [Labilithrix sp.]
MSDDKPRPVDDLKEGLGLLFRAAKGAVEKLPTDKLEDVAKDAAKEVGRAFESLGSEIEKVVGKVSGSGAAAPEPPPAAAQPAPPTHDAPPPEPPRYDDGYAPEPPPKGPRVG